MGAGLLAILAPRSSISTALIPSRASPLPQKSRGRGRSVPSQIRIAHFFVAQQFLAGAGQADFAVDHHIGPV
ncbi:hypothetical protein C7A07_00390 [Pseudomonas fragi]|nr:hypothetical protein C7A07_00390 [Pseudomonas fragi]